MKKKLLKYLNDAREGFVLLSHVLPLGKENEKSINSRFWGVFSGYAMGIAIFIFGMYNLHTVGTVSMRELDKTGILIYVIVISLIFFRLYDKFVEPRISFHKVDLNQSKQQKRYKIWLHLGIGFGGLVFILIVVGILKLYQDYIIH